MQSWPAFMNLGIILCLLAGGVERLQELGCLRYQVPPVCSTASFHDTGMQLWQGGIDGAHETNPHNMM